MGEAKGRAAGTPKGTIPTLTNLNASFSYRPLLVLVVLIVVTLRPASAVANSHEPTDDEVNAIAKQLYCPVCENVPLDACGTQACAQWRATIYDKLTAGWDGAQIKLYFAEQYGVRVLAQPPASGFNVLLWLIPPLMLTAGLFFTLRFVQYVHHPRSTSVQDDAETDPDEGYRARWESELERWQ